MNKTKVCKKCDRELPVSEFYETRKENKAGEIVIYYGSPCRDCTHARNAVRRAVAKAPVSPPVVKREPLPVPNDERKVRHVGERHSPSDWMPDWMDREV